VPVRRGHGIKLQERGWRKKRHGNRIKAEPGGGPTDLHHTEVRHLEEKKKGTLGGEAAAICAGITEGHLIQREGDIQKGFQGREAEKRRESKIGIRESTA